MYQAAYLTSLFVLGGAASSFLAWGSGLPGPSKGFILLLVLILLTFAVSSALDEWVADRLGIPVRIYWGAWIFFFSSFAIGQGVWWCSKIIQ